MRMGSVTTLAFPHRMRPPPHSLTCAFVRPVISEFGGQFLDKAEHILEELLGHLKHNSLIFSRYDSLTGVPSCQRTVAFEKASVLFNIAALYTQIGTRQDRDSQKGLDSAVDNFLRSAGTFQYIHENFTNAPSMDLQPDTLEMLVHLMCAQARECLFEKAELHAALGDGDDDTEAASALESRLILGQEAAHVSEVGAHCTDHVLGYTSGRIPGLD